MGYLRDVLRTHWRAIDLHDVFLSSQKLDEGATFALMFFKTLATNFQEKNNLAPTPSQCKGHTQVMKSEKWQPVKSGALCSKTLRTSWSSSLSAPGSSVEVVLSQQECLAQSVKPKSRFQSSTFWRPCAPGMQRRAGGPASLWCYRVSSSIPLIFTGFPNLWLEWWVMISKAWPLRSEAGGQWGRSVLLNFPFLSSGVPLFCSFTAAICHLHIMWRGAWNQRADGRWGPENIQLAVLSGLRTRNASNEIESFLSAAFLRFVWGCFSWHQFCKCLLNLYKAYVEEGEKMKELLKNLCTAVISIFSSL